MKAKKRILFLGDDFELKNQRGIGFYSKSLIKTCYEMGFDNYIMTSAPDSKYQNIRELLIYQKLMNPEPFARRSPWLPWAEITPRITSSTVRSSP